MNRIDVTPDSKKSGLGKWFYETGYSGGGAVYGVHLSRDEVERRMIERHGHGYLEEEGDTVWFIQPDLDPSFIGEGI